MSRKKRINSKRHHLRRLESSILQIAALLDEIEKRPHPLLRKSATALVPYAEPPQSTLAEYTERFATIVKSSGSLRD